MHSVITLRLNDEENPKLGNIISFFFRDKSLQSVKVRGIIDKEDYHKMIYEPNYDPYFIIELQFKGLFADTNGNITKIHKCIVKCNLEEISFLPSPFTIDIKLTQYVKDAINSTIKHYISQL